jgi:hypothetical protein
VNRAQRRRWQKNVLRFARACGGAAESYIIPAEARAKISLAALCGEPTGIALAKAIAIWTEQAMRPRRANVVSRLRHRVWPERLAGGVRSLTTLRQSRCRNHHRRVRELHRARRRTAAQGAAAAAVNFS